MHQHRRRHHDVPALPCRLHDADLWFADSPAEVELAKDLCLECPLLNACLQAALERAEVHFLEEQNPRIAAREVCEGTVEVGGRRLRAKAAAADAFAAVDLVMEKLAHQLQTAKTKVGRKRHALPLGMALAGLDDS